MNHFFKSHNPALVSNNELPHSAMQKLKFCIAFFSAALLGMASAAWAADDTDDAQGQDVRFNEQLLRQYGGEVVDISRFSRKNTALPGQYRADVYINQRLIGRKEIDVREVQEMLEAQPCFNLALLEELGVDLQKLSLQNKAALENEPDRCFMLPELIDSAYVTFDSSTLKLDVSIPQAIMLRKPRRYVNPEQWDDGVTAARLNYNANIYHYSSGGKSTTQSFLGLRAGLNMGAWRFRHIGNLTHDSDNGTSYNHTQNYLQRSIEPVKGKLTIGDSYTSGQFFDSYGFRGVQLATDERMYPESLRGFAPIVRGTANSNARVQIYQNNNIIYETNVSPGPFEIEDLYPTGWYSGDLEVVVTEADGSIRRFTVPYAASVNALRPGVTHYAATVGRYRNSASDQTPMVSQVTLQHGFTNNVTLYGGSLVSPDYYSILVGSALNTYWGAFGLDATYARVEDVPGYGTMSGKSVRLSYSKHIAPSDTNIDISFSRHLSEGYITFPNAMYFRDAQQSLSSFSPAHDTDLPRSRLQATINQNLGKGAGSIYFMGSTQDYWNRSGHDTQFQFGYNNSYKDINYGVFLSRQYSVSEKKWSNRFMITVGIPLGNGVGYPYSRTTAQYDSGSKTTTLQESVSGVTGEDLQIAYNLNATHINNDNTKDTNSMGGSVNYKAPFATLGAGFTRANNYTQTRLSMSGGIVAYQGGVVLAPDLSDTVAIIEAQHAAGARISNNNGVKLDSQGHAVVSNLTVFSENEVVIDPKGLPLNVSLNSTSERVAPTADAIVQVTFETENTGRAAVLRALMSNGKPLPFGANVFDEKNQQVGSIAQAGKIIAIGLKTDHGVLTVKWGESSSQQCTLNYALPAMAENSKESFVTVSEILSCI